MWRRPALTAFVMVGAVGTGVGLAPAWAQRGNSDRVEAGRRVAARFCGECHAVTPNTVSPLPDALPMSQLYLRFPVERMGEAIELGMMKDHPRMPDFDLGDDERQALSDYLSSFNPKARPTPRKHGAGAPSDT